MQLNAQSIFTCTVLTHGHVRVRKYLRYITCTVFTHSHVQQNELTSSVCNTDVTWSNNSTSIVLTDMMTDPLVISAYQCQHVTLIIEQDD